MRHNEVGVAVMNISKQHRMSLVEWAERIYPNSKGWRVVSKNWRFCALGSAFPTIMERMIEVFNEPYLAPVLADYPEVITKPLKPYLNVSLSMPERVAMLHDHYRFMANTFGRHCSTIFSVAGLPLVSFTANNGRQYGVRFYRGAIREGALGLSLYDVESKQGVYSISFHFNREGRELYIGALQGPSDSVPDRHQIIKMLTKTAHGLRTKALMLELVLMLGRIMGAERCYAVSNKGHIYKAIRYITSKRNVVTFDYDELWREYDGMSLSRYMYALPMQPIRKDVTQLSGSKRRLYTKRYAWLHTLEQDLRLAINALTETRAEMHQVA
ncbi:hypothetical protein BZJ17_05895 [Salinivibrio sp. IB574]|uniref:VirK/YbjX family protein n=1 Tax=Salinivibrio sp. IB574 TaxID=1909444 RepID=UPI0009C75B21|nr:VirK/YbjX family protein [Salinivibrio sp. IB574]OOF22522.1 hypothetical protein BZJ17_05895 [Salinivibrio sp. IB574]